jgi:hypothetical protein
MYWTCMSTSSRARRENCSACYIHRTTISPRLLKRCRSSYRRCFARCSEDVIVLDLAIVKMDTFHQRRRRIVSVVRDIGAYSRYWSCTSPSIQSSGSSESLPLLLQMQTPNSRAKLILPFDIMIRILTTHRQDLGNLEQSQIPSHRRGHRRTNHLRPRTRRHTNPSPRVPSNHILRFILQHDRKRVLTTSNSIREAPRCPHLPGYHHARNSPSLARQTSGS